MAAKHSLSSPSFGESGQPTQGTLANLTDFYWFLQVVDCGSFSRAAEQTGMAKSSLSRRVSQLEERLGVQLIHRGSRNSVLTAVGTEIYRHCLDIIASAEAASECAHNALQQPQGHISFSFPAILSDWILPMLRAFSASHGKISLSLHSVEHREELLANRIDLALSLAPPPQDSLEIVSRPIALLEFIEVASPGQDADAPLLNLPAKRTDTDVSLRIHELHTALAAAKCGLGKVLVPRCACLAELARGELLVRSSSIPLRHELHAFTQGHRRTTMATRTLLDFITQQITHKQIPGILPATDIL